MVIKKDLQGQKCIIYEEYYEDGTLMWRESNYCGSIYVLFEYFYKNNQ